jgi:uncharacterized membrane protein HdeD (DUF308 family)
MNPQNANRVSAGITIALGVAAILLPYFFTTLAVMMLAAVMLASGVVALLNANTLRGAGYRVSRAGPVVQVLVGIVLLIWPDLALWVVAMLLGGGLIVHGVVGVLDLKESNVVNPPLGARLLPWSGIVLGALLILMGAAGSAVLLGIVLGVALIGSGLRQWQAAGARG